ncbi:N-methyl-L-tryptophan oxidase [Cohnella nanjingensis]|uniref:N-methyl-L-tryptophan oxidase n=1 Tax=Cohnella nanjingensis TaxID=1387779 RepID=A0A7X0RN32_9BACL|nr:N-methyl-L-tryptophan oxidase [Cohnella nanjingensis]MBB6669240.1 N-methyl-L-tryptophan oxidase [Cohnella nanjingensis]
MIVGAGSMGMSAGYFLARRGLKPLLIDAFDPPHDQGSHHGDSRLIRHAYAGAPAYVPMALRADALWRELEQTSETQLLHRTGVLNMGPADARHLREKEASAAAFGLDVPRLDAHEIDARWPGLRLPEGYAGLFEPEAGYLSSERAVSAFRQQAVAHGAAILPYTRVESLQVTDGHVSVRTNNGNFHAEQVILSAGAWFKTLEPFIALPIRPVRKVVGWFEADEELYGDGVFPGFTIDAPGGYFYGFPSIAGAGVKIGRHDTGVVWRPGEEIAPFGRLAEDEADLRSALEAFLPKAAGRLLHSAVCKYEVTPDEDFIIDRHPAYGNVLLAGGFSGHGFKFSSAVGEMLADLVTAGEAKLDISPFSLRRFQGNGVQAFV